MLCVIKVCNLGGEVVVHARTMLSQEHTGTKFDHIWGPGDGQRTVKELKLSIDQLCEVCVLCITYPHIAVVTIHTTADPIPPCVVCTISRIVTRMYIGISSIQPAGGSYSMCQGNEHQPVSS